MMPEQPRVWTVRQQGKENTVDPLLQSPGAKYAGIRSLMTRLEDLQQQLEEANMAQDFYRTQVMVLRQNWTEAFQALGASKKAWAQQAGQLLAQERQLGAYIREIEEAETFYFHTTAEQRARIARQDASLGSLSARCHLLVIFSSLLSLSLVLFALSSLGCFSDLIRW
ncbi:MAG: hypothetical protein Q8P67_20055 [archaeon]|nr:hypothetical protein [archaeon]